MTTGRDNGSAAAPRRTDARQNRERLLAAAREVFGEAGPEASLNEIARRAGVGPGTLYRHFPNRASLVTAVLGDRIRRLAELADELLSDTSGTSALSGTSADDALARWLGAFLDHARVNQGMGSALLIEEAGGLGLDCHQVIRDAAAGLLARAQLRGSARLDLTADDLVQLVVGIALSTAKGHDPEQPGRLLALVLDAVFRTPREP
ncbi:TetR/AcrR family transcriptional regulator [Streptomyces sp. NPDC058001]|uniref:TetR/AcrR family transcriptional regulator n=1 Tax=Streptomyces sp. NPDC058001 TaxID=3346300 RepID=UPI0036EEFC75